MTKLKSHKKVLYTIIAFLLIVILWGDCLSGFALFSRIQYNNITSDMNSVEATVIDVTGQHIKSSRGRTWRWIYVTYEVDGFVYEQELKMIVGRMFIKMKEDSYYSVGDKIIIFYELGNPNKIAYPNSVEREELYEFICLGALVLTGVIDFILDRCNKSADSKKAKTSST